MLKVSNRITPLPAPQSVANILSVFSGSKWIYIACTFFIGLQLTACEKDDLGKICGTEVTPITDNPVGGEVPAVEVVRMERDVACQSFQCLRHLGIAPYCTRECKLGPSTGTCADDSACGRGTTCINGQCVDDDCSPGFWCRTVQDTGPLAGKNFCTRRTGCNPADPFECEDIGNIECKVYGCFDTCLSKSSTECVFHELVCDSMKNIPCTCGLDLDPTDLSCADAELQCANAVRTWPAESVQRIHVCESIEPVQ